MRQVSTHFLRFVLALAGVIVLAFCVFGLPNAWHGAPAEFPEAGLAAKMIVAVLYVTAVPFYAALWQTFKLLAAIDRGAAFSQASVDALRVIKRCAGLITLLYCGMVPLLFPIADLDDAPGLILFGMVAACAPAAVAVFAAVLQRLLQDAVAMKSENDLTV